jgi:hypothetical protein
MFEKIMTGFTIGVIILVFALLIFATADKELGEKNTYLEKVTVTDTYKKFVKSGNATITKYYITIATETGTEDISVTHDFYNKVEVNNEIEVTKTIIETKFTHDTVIKYDIN